VDQHIGVTIFPGGIWHGPEAKPTGPPRCADRNLSCAARDKGSHSAFLVGKKTFAYYLNNHHDDNIISVCCKVLPGENRFLVESGPVRFYLPAYIGARGWIGLHMDLATLNWTEVKELIYGSYMQIAPNRLVSLVKR
jgi:phosphoribosylglycinamide formyltransferase-1